MSLTKIDMDYPAELHSAVICLDLMYMGVRAHAMCPLQMHCEPEPAIAETYTICSFSHVMYKSSTLLEYTKLLCICTLERHCILIANIHISIIYIYIYIYILEHCMYNFILYYIYVRFRVYILGYIFVNLLIFWSGD